MLETLADIEFTNNSNWVLPLVSLETGIARFLEWFRWYYNCWNALRLASICQKMPTTMDTR